MIGSWHYFYFKLEGKFIPHLIKINVMQGMNIYFEKRAIFENIFARQNTGCQ
jgi:hypothetical protein